MPPEQEPQQQANTRLRQDATCGSIQTSYAAYVKAQSWSRVYKQTFIDTYKVGLCKLHDRKTPIAAADLLNDSVLPFLDEHDVKLLGLLTDGGSDFCGNPERHEYELYFAVEGMDHSHTRPRARIPKVSASTSARPHSQSQCDTTPIG